MELKTVTEEKTLNVAISGRIDTLTAPQIQQQIEQLPDDYTYVLFDFTKVEYISSAGLRMLLFVEKLAEKKGGYITVKSPTEQIMEIFEMTGFVDMFNIEA